MLVYTVLVKKKRKRNMSSSIVCPHYVFISVKSVREELKRGVLLCSVLLLIVVILAGDAGFIRSIDVAKNEVK